MKNNNNDNKILLWDDEYNNRVNDYMGKDIRHNETSIEDNNDGCTISGDWSNHSNESEASDDEIISFCKVPTNWLTDDNDNNLTGESIGLLYNQINIKIDIIPVLLVIDLTSQKNFDSVCRLERLKSFLEGAQCSLNHFKYTICVGTMILTPYQSYIKDFIQVDEWNPYEIFESTRLDYISKEYIDSSNPYLEVIAYLRAIKNDFYEKEIYWKPYVIVLSNEWNDENIQQIEEIYNKMDNKNRIYVSINSFGEAMQPYNDYLLRGNVFGLRDYLIPNMIMKHFMIWDDWHLNCNYDHFSFIEDWKLDSMEGKVHSIDISKIPKDW